MQSRGTGRSNGDRSDASSWTTVFALVAQLGFSIACPMVFFIGGGAWLDSRLGWGPWLLLLGVALGLATAGGLFYQVIARLPTAKRSPTGAKSRGGAAPYKVEQESGFKDSD